MLRVPPLDDLEGSDPYLKPDWRDIATGSVIYTSGAPWPKGYCDSTNAAALNSGDWLCVLTTCEGEEGQPGSHVVSVVSQDKGKTWLPPVDIEPACGTNCANPVLLVVPSGRAYAFYDFNIDNVTTLPDGTKMPQVYCMGAYCYKYSDDHGRTWSQRYRLPLRLTEVDRQNTWKGKVQMFWGSDHPTICNNSVYIPITKVKFYHQKESEGWFFRSDNILSEPDPEKIEWELLPDGEQGLRDPEHGSVQSEQNLVALDNGDLYCMYRTQKGYPCHAYSRDGAHSWSTPVPATYAPGGRRFKHNRACPRLWKTKDGRYLFWFNNHSGDYFWPRNPIWITAGVEKDGFIHWSQPEILMYGPRPKFGMSYPDLIEEEGKYWITETQKTIARIHQIDGSLLEGMWNQGKVKDISTDGLVLSLQGDEAACGQTADMPHLPPFNPFDGEVGSFSIDFKINFETLSPGQILLDARNEIGRGVVVTTVDGSGVRIELNDQQAIAAWDCRAEQIAPGACHHIVIIVDGQSKIISFVIDGVLWDGGPMQQYGWSRFSHALDDVNGSKVLKIGPSLKGHFQSIRIYNRYLRTSEAIANFHALK
jgi:hypothetical protein